jgi:hypothetical protein
MLYLVGAHGKASYAMPYLVRAQSKASYGMPYLVGAHCKTEGKLAKVEQPVAFKEGPCCSRVEKLRFAVNQPLDHLDIAVHDGNVQQVFTGVAVCVCVCVCVYVCVCVCVRVSVSERKTR